MHLVFFALVYGLSLLRNRIARRGSRGENEQDGLPMVARDDHSAPNDAGVFGAKEDGEINL